MKQYPLQISFEDLIGIFKRDAAEMTGTRVRELLEDLIITEKEISKHASFSGHRYSRNVVIKDKEFEILMISWKSGQRSLIHDHGSSFGGVKVLRGILTESLFAPALNGMIKAIASRDYHVGDIQIEDPCTIHQVSNLQPPGSDAISLHIYIPPFNRMKTYKLYDIDVHSVSTELFINGSGI